MSVSFPRSLSQEALLTGSAVSRRSTLAPARVPGLSRTSLVSLPLAPLGRSLRADSVRPSQTDWTGTQGRCLTSIRGFSSCDIADCLLRLPSADWVPFLSISAALDFRAFLGGEDRIMEHNHALAVEGGKHLQKMFGGTAIMENEKGRGALNGDSASAAH